MGCAARKSRIFNKESHWSISKQCVKKNGVRLLWYAFPCQVGVFPADENLGLRLPCVSGGVSCSPVWKVTCSPSSPRKRGCFLLARLEGHLQPVFPA